MCYGGIVRSTFTVTGCEMSDESGGAVCFETHWRVRIALARI